jgi:hypothetical protein
VTSIQLIVDPTEAGLRHSVPAALPRRLAHRGWEPDAAAGLVLFKGQALPLSKELVLPSSTVCAKVDASWLDATIAPYRLTPVEVFGAIRS